MAPVPKLVLLALLYLVEGLPYGMQTQALPLYLREQGLSLGAISSFTVLAVPWLLKPLWAPFVDRYGTRKRWILALLAVLLVVCELGALAHTLPSLVLTMLVMNLVSATLDIPVDGLAVDLLGPRDLGAGNAIQVGGYKIGMLGGGWALGYAAAGAGLGTHMALMGVPIVIALAATALWRAPDASTPPERSSLAEILRTLGHALATPASAWVIACVATYKLGENFIDPMFKLFVKDAGFPRAQVLTWTALYGMAASIAGSLAGGVLATRVSLRRALLLAAAVRVGPVVAEWIVASRPPVASTLVAVILAENFCGGALTTVLFAFMMASVDRRIGATHYTVLAGVEVMGKMPGSAVSGFVADAFGYAATFALGAALSVAYLPVLWLGMRGSERIKLSGREGDA